ncbi:coiled-coil domain-containing protein 43-like isoform X2 [Antedon mediterranea]|uniref:coiled-coil domain-containing protein 43-like isoform X2 n=1 Tax=Antedon mediterranea TaxID=105859 RepID=UPI003AF9991A
MANATCEPDFGSWLIKRLEQLSIDHEVFGSYITGILETEDISDEDKSEALYGVIGGVTEEEEVVESTCKEIITKWHETEQATPGIDNGNYITSVFFPASESSESKMASIMEKHATTVLKKEVASNQSTAEKQRLLAQYAEISDNEEDEEDQDGNDDGFKNRNAEDVAKRQREQREKDKSQHEQRKEQNRLQQEKQKQAALDRKEKEKKRTQKQEKHR